jgi:SPP1 family predicted phage head-tail adaptor
MSSETRIGDLRTRLTLEAPSRSGDGGGGSSVTWTTVAQVWAMVRPTAGNEAYELDRLAGRISHEIVIRHRTDAKPQMRFRAGTRVFDIRALFDPDGRGRWTKCLAEERDL